MNIEPALEALVPLVSNRAAIERYAGTVTVTFYGYDGDDLELWEIPEVRAWFRRLTAAFPFWFLFTQRRADPLALVINLLLGPGTPVPGRDGRPPMRRHPVGALSDLMRNQFSALNTLCAQVAIPVETSLRWTREVVEALESAATCA